VRAALAEARTIWGGAGAVIDSDRVLATLDAVPDARTEDRLAAMLPRGRQAAAGIQAEAVAVPLAFGPAGDSWVHIQVLGRFEVRVRNRPVPASAWQSRKARDLLRILVARRARVVPRDELAELLWPEDDPTRTGHRLSVLLSLVRSVLDPDRSAAADQYIVADKTGIALDPSRIRIDVEEFLADITHGSRLYDQGALAQARSVLTAAPLREQARAAHQRAHRTLARLARRSGDTDEALCHLLAILERDPYDEDAHRTIVATLVAAGRHGEARRAHDRYVEAMRSIGLPDPGGTPEPRSMIGVA
jgi:DNA-binding SARP family transcriptional activator